MGRIRRVVAIGCPHHVTQRGNFRRDVFFDDEDRHTYLDLLAAAASDAQLAVLGYCLMSNHVHLIVVPAHAGSMALAIREAHRNYSRWLNLRLRRTGHVWQNRYFSRPLDPAHAAYAMRYVESNPVRAGMTESVLDYEWSSARAHAGIGQASAPLSAGDWASAYPAEKWKEVLGLGFRHSGDLDRLQEATRTGRPFGAPDFVAQLETRLDRALFPRKPGPKPKSPDRSLSATASGEDG